MSSFHFRIGRNMSRTFLTALVCLLALLPGCRPSQPTPDATSDLGIIEEADAPANAAGHDTPSPTIADTTPPASAAAPAPAQKPVNIDEIIELEFSGDDDFDRDLRRDANPFPADKLLLAAEIQKRGLEFGMRYAQAYDRLTKDGGEARRVANSLGSDIRFRFWHFDNGYTSPTLLLRV